MASSRAKLVHVCSECGTSHPKWSGRCSGCGDWNTLVEDVETAGRDVAPIIARTANLLRDESRFLDASATTLDPTDARALVDADPVLARRAIRLWLTEDGYPPDTAAVERVLAVARGEAVACELPGGRRVARSGQRLRVVDP